MSTMASQITSSTIVYSGADQRKHQRSASLAFVRGIHRWPVNSLHKGPVTRKVFPFDDVIMITDSAIFRRCDCYSLILSQTCCLGLRHGQRTNKFHSLMWKWSHNHNLHLLLSRCISIGNRGRQMSHENDVNSLAPGKFEWNFRYVLFKRILMIDGWGISCEIALIWMSLDFTDDQSILVHVMAWCREFRQYFVTEQA